MGLGVTGCSSEPAPTVDASADGNTKDAKTTDATFTPDAPFQTDAPADVSPPSDATSDPDGCTHVCFGQNWPCSFPCYV